jgi:predicted RNA-binding Zn-ribbon protein involved in translation (DUF1610 family)
MALEMPDSMDECLYFTRRTLDNNGKIVAWVKRKLCSKCGKARMGKPVDKGKVKIRAKEYICPGCGHTEDKKEHEESCEMEIVYTCPFCGNQGEATTNYKLRSFEGAKAYVFECGKCAKKIGITKKMKGL